ncbi:YsnF/AvaK domain-containing protein [Deinococcus sp.]|uniref:YsnF/AvaK domain-containing protein n=1 Tax=Deinococcus sp. TaxID=47478 RepID=UPI003B5B6873
MDSTDPDQTVTIREVRPPKEVATLTLHEERASVAVTEGASAQVTVQRRVIEEETQVSVMLRREVLELITSPEGGTVLLDGQALEAGRVYQITLTEERPVIGKEVYPVQQITLRKEWISETFQQKVTLGREVLDVSGPQELIREHEQLVQAQAAQLPVLDEKEPALTTLNKEGEPAEALPAVGEATPPKPGG